MEDIRQGRSGPEVGGADILIRPLNGVMMLRNIICKYLIFFNGVRHTVILRNG